VAGLDLHRPKQVVTAPGTIFRGTRYIDISDIQTVMLNLTRVRTNCPKYWLDDSVFQLPNRSVQCVERESPFPSVQHSYLTLPQPPYLQGRVLTDRDLEYPKYRPAEVYFLEMIHDIDAPR
jgi:hypothetical protein